MSTAISIIFSFISGILAAAICDRYEISMFYGFAGAMVVSTAFAYTLWLSTV